MKDPGTDLLNKRAITDYVRKLIDSQPGHTVTIAIIDIDDFKTINDTYGHMFGDEVLCKVADILRDAVGSRGLCGRIGGDEMFIIMEGLNDNEGIRNVLRTIRNNTKWLYMMIRVILRLHVQLVRQLILMMPRITMNYLR